MVLEHLFPEEWLEKRERYAFLIAFIYSTISIIVARILFPSNSGIVSVIFLSLLLIPYIDKLLFEEEEEEEKEKKFSLKELFKDNKTGLKVFFALFFGIYFTYMLYSLIFPLLGFNVSVTFKEQLALEGLKGGAIFSTNMFLDIFLNNWWVLLACFLLALLVGDGAIFFIVWNASVWGTIFGYRAFAAAAATGSNPFVNLLIIVAVTLPHVILEGGAYIIALIAGGVISDDVIKKSSEIREFLLWLVGGGVIYVILAYLVSMLVVGFISGIIHIFIAGIIIWFLKFVFTDFTHREVFNYNYYFFWIGIIIFILGAIIETFVIGNVNILQKIYLAALSLG